jgi:hypothetical protein
MSEPSILIPLEAEKILKAFSRTLSREAYVLTEHSDLLWQQMYNHPQWLLVVRENMDDSNMDGVSLVLAGDW